MEKEVIIDMNGNIEKEEEESPKRDPEDEVNELQEEFRAEAKSLEPVFLIYSEYMPNAPAWEHFRLFSNNYEIEGCVVGWNRREINMPERIWPIVEKYKKRLENELKGKVNLSIEVKEYKSSTNNFLGFDLQFHYTEYGFFGHPFCEYGTMYRISFIQVEQI